MTRTEEFKAERKRLHEKLIGLGCVMPDTMSNIIVALTMSDDKHSEDFYIERWKGNKRTWWIKE